MIVVWAFLVLISTFGKVKNQCNNRTDKLCSFNIYFLWKMAIQFFSSYFSFIIKNNNRQTSTSRVEIFCDAVVAIIMAIMVLELILRRLNDEQNAFGIKQHFIDQLPHFGAYISSITCRLKGGINYCSVFSSRLMDASMAVPNRSFAWCK